MVFIFLAYFTLYNELPFHPSHQNWFKWILFNGWVIFHGVYVPQLPYPFICWWASRLLPCPGYDKQCCDEHWGARVSFRPGFLGEYTPFLYFSLEMELTFLHQLEILNSYIVNSFPRLLLLCCAIILTPDYENVAVHAHQLAIWRLLLLLKTTCALGNKLQKFTSGQELFQNGDLLHILYLISWILTDNRSGS